MLKIGTNLFVSILMILTNRYNYTLENPARLMFPVYIKHSIDLHCKSNNWLPRGVNIGLKRAKKSHDTKKNSSRHFFFWNSLLHGHWSLQFSPITCPKLTSLLWIFACNIAITRGILLIRILTRLLHMHPFSNL